MKLFLFLIAVFLGTCGSVSYYMWSKGILNKRKFKKLLSSRNPKNTKRLQKKMNLATARGTGSIGGV